MDIQQLNDFLYCYSSFETSSQISQIQHCCRIKIKAKHNILTSDYLRLLFTCLVTQNCSSRTRVLQVPSPCDPCLHPRTFGTRLMKNPRRRQERNIGRDFTSTANDGIKRTLQYSSLNLSVPRPDWSVLLLAEYEVARMRIESDVQFE